MAADLIAGLITLTCSFILLLLIGWILGSLDLRRKISQAVKLEALPRRWLQLSFLPGLGHWFFSGYQTNWQPFRLRSKGYDFKVMRDVSDAKWLIVQEHIDDPFAIRKGSTLTALKSHVLVYSFQEVTELPDEDSSIIRVTTPRKSYDDPEWGQMSFRGMTSENGKSGWIIQNRKSNVPVLVRQGREFFSIDPGNKSEVLGSSTKIYMGTTTYSLIKLPDIGLRPILATEIGTLIAGICFIGSSPSCDVHLTDGHYPIIAVFDNGRLTVLNDMDLKIVGYSDEINIANRLINSSASSRTYKLFIGDRFTIQGAQFIVDYL